MYIEVFLTRLGRPDSVKRFTVEKCQIIPHKRSVQLPEFMRKSSYDDICFSSVTEYKNEGRHTYQSNIGPPVARSSVLASLWKWYS